MPVRDSSGSFTVDPGSGGGSQVVLETSFEALDGAQEEQVRQMMDQALQQALEALKRRVERGARWNAP